ncbi:MAG: pyridoxamine 5'-phosphate oxidase family protein [Candidatus Bathyarchaeota archaeon]|nr:pyridoxamine 5'-phosphate oxidase family protein [Candidatus Bathyarchaeota archaeon]
MFYHLRRKEQEIANVDAMKQVLGSTQYVTIALCRNNEPYLVTLSHGYDFKRNCIYFHCATEGKKLDYIRANNRVWGQAMIDEGFVEGECKQSYTSVQFLGKVVFPQNVDEKLEALTCMIRQLNKNPEKTQAQIAALNPDTNLKNLMVGRIDIQYLSGKQSKREA